jgi:hypothetical protein
LEKWERDASMHNRQHRAFKQQCKEKNSLTHLQFKKMLLVTLSSLLQVQKVCEANESTAFITHARPLRHCIAAPHYVSSANEQDAAQEPTVTD